MSFGPKEAGNGGVELTANPRLGAAPLEKVYVLWLAGMSCEDCSISVTGAAPRFSPVATTGRLTRRAVRRIG
jgi:hypothetical protein